MKTAIVCHIHPLRPFASKLAKSYIIIIIYLQYRLWEIEIYLVQMSDFYDWGGDDGNSSDIAYRIATGGVPKVGNILYDGQGEEFDDAIRNYDTNEDDDEENDDLDQAPVAIPYVPKQKNERHILYS